MWADVMFRLGSWGRPASVLWTLSLMQDVSDASLMWRAQFRANQDVTDSTLLNLRGMTRLRELDLSGTQVDDDGLKELEPLKGLETLRLQGTRITDEGFRKWLQPREGLKQLDLRKTAVTKETGKAWRDAQAGRRLLQ